MYRRHARTRQSVREMVAKQLKLRCAPQRQDEALNAFKIYTNKQNTLGII